MQYTDQPQTFNNPFGAAAAYPQGYPPPDPYVPPVTYPQDSGYPPPNAGGPPQVTAPYAPQPYVEAPSDPYVPMGVNAPTYSSHDGYSGERTGGDVELQELVGDWDESRRNGNKYEEKSKCKVLLVRLGVTLLQGAILTGAVVGFLYANAGVGNAGVWGFSFLLAFLPIPVVFGLGIVAGCVTGEHIFAGMSVWACVLAFSFSFPTAILHNKLSIATRLEPITGETVMEVNCWERPPNVTQWNTQMEFIRWQDNSYVIDPTAMKVSTVTYSGTYYTFCAAPIRYIGTGVQPCPICAYAICYEARTSPGPCSAASLESCGWLYKPARVISRALRKRAFYAPYTDQEEYDAYYKAIGTTKCAGGYSPLAVEWFAEMDPTFFSDRQEVLTRDTGISDSIYLWTWVASWGIASIPNVLVPTGKNQYRFSR